MLVLASALLHSAKTQAIPKLRPAVAQGVRAFSGSDELLGQWNVLLQRGWATPAAAGAPPEPKQTLSTIRNLVKESLRTQLTRLDGDIIPAAMSSTFINMYRASANTGEHAGLLKLLCTELGVQEQDVAAAVAQWSRAHSRSASGSSTEMLSKAAKELQLACTPLYMHLLRSFSQQPEGIKFLLGLRADLLAHLKRHPAYAADLRSLNEHLRSDLATWFGVGSLGVQRVTWEATPAAFLEKVMAGEAVHPMSSWADLRQRLGPQRRVYAVTHPSLPDEPLVVLHTALMQQVPSAMDEVLDAAAGSAHEPRPPPTTAAFYSISSLQPGLSGVDLGNFLIKRVASLVQAEFPSVTTLVTLSPLPKFRDWLHARLLRAPPVDRQPLEEDPLAALQQPSTEAQLQALCGLLPPGVQEGQPMQGLPPAQVALMRLLQEERWLSLPGEGQEVVQQLLVRLAAVYLAKERRRNLALDPVANFHLRNGATLHRVLPRADTSPRGLRRSHGVMVNYLYELPKVKVNSQQYLVEHQVPTSPEVQALLSSSR